LALRCSGIKRDGGRCTAVVEGEFCYQHDPGRADERKRNASRAGKSRPSRELADIKRRLSDLADDVLEDRQDRGNAAVAGQLLNTIIRAVSVELKAKEQLELIERLERLEENMTPRQTGARRWAEHGQG
jgi:hypothetical protein